MPQLLVCLWKKWGGSLVGPGCRNHSNPSSSAAFERTIATIQPGRQESLARAGNHLAHFVAGWRNSQRGSITSLHLKQPGTWHHRHRHFSQTLQMRPIHPHRRRGVGLRRNSTRESSRCGENETSWIWADVSSLSPISQATQIRLSSFWACERRG